MTIDLESFPEPEAASKTAESNFLSGLNCTQAVLCTFAHSLGLDEETAKKITLAMGGGMCRMRETCGTVTGMLLALGLLESNGNTGDKQNKDSVYAHGQELAGKFKELNGSIECRELLGLVPLGSSDALLHKQPLPQKSVGKDAQNTVNGNAENPQSEERTPDYYKRRPCPKLCGIAAKIFAEYVKTSHES